MAVNRSRDMHAELMQGVIDGSYIQLAPDRGGVVGDSAAERAMWPSYRQAGMKPDNPMESFSIPPTTVDAIGAGVPHAGARSISHNFGSGSPSSELSMG